MRHRTSRLRNGDELMVISFSHDTAWEQLVTEREVVTFRTQRRANPNCSTWCNRGRGQTKEFDVRIEEIGCVEPTPTVLSEFVSTSGFEDVHKWIEAIHNLNGTSPREGWLYRVVPEEIATVQISETPV